MRSPTTLYHVFEYRWRGTFTETKRLISTEETKDDAKQIVNERNALDNDEDALRYVIIPIASQYESEFCDE